MCPDSLEKMLSWDVFLRAVSHTHLPNSNENTEPPLKQDIAPVTYTYTMCYTIKVYVYTIYLKIKSPHLLKIVSVACDYY
jgi:hypothetical protein